MRIGCRGGVDVQLVIQHALKHTACLACFYIHHHVSKAPALAAKVMCHTTAADTQKDLV